MNLFDALHVALHFSPLLLLLVKKEILGPYFKYILLLFMLIPSVWPLTGCALTELSIAHGGLQQATTSNQFSEVYMGWLYRPMTRLFGWEWDDDGIKKALCVHIIVTQFVLWFYLFYVAKEAAV